jgi:YfiH family protein
MQRKKWNGLEWLEFDLLSQFPKVKHAVFTRHGGCSQGAYANLNTGLSVGDNPHHVATNIERISAQLRNDTPHWINYAWGNAVHGKQIAHVHASSPQEAKGCDGLITNQLGRSLMMKHGDCQVGLFYDPVNHATANVHAGWRGSVANIYQEAVRHLQDVFGSNPANIHVCITPSLAPEEAEFINYKTELPDTFWDFQTKPNFFDFWAISTYQLQAEGILPHHIEIARIGTMANPEDFFSHRRDKITGRNASCITLL